MGCSFSSLPDLGFFLREEVRSELWEILQPELSQVWLTELYP